MKCEKLTVNADYGIMTTMLDDKPYSFDGFFGYNLYWREADMWLYYNSTTQDLEWFEKGTQTSGYSLYLKTFNNGTAKIGSTVPYGHSLVLYAKW